MRELKNGVFGGWSEGRLNFPPTYKYEVNSDKYYGEDPKVGKRSPAWYAFIQILLPCLLILWLYMYLSIISFFSNFLGIYNNNNNHFVSCLFLIVPYLL